jgi:hypothetical protein
VESALESVEGAAAAAMAEIDRTGRLPKIGSQERFDLAVFVAAQAARTTKHREQVLFPQRVVEWLGGREATEALIREFLTTEHLGFAPRKREPEGALLFVQQQIESGVLNREFAIRMQLEATEAFVPRLLPLNWTLETSRRARFITSDAPVVLWRKPSRLDNHEGVGVETADEIRFPLDPAKQLVLSKRRRADILAVEVHRVRRSNEDVAAACHRFIVGDPADTNALSRIPLETRPPAIRFNVAPLLVAGPNGEQVPNGDVFHMFVPTRRLRA